MSNEYVMLEEIALTLKNICQSLRSLEALAYGNYTPGSTPSTPERIPSDPTLMGSDPVSDAMLSQYNPLSDEDRDALKLS